MLYVDPREVYLNNKYIGEKWRKKRKADGPLVVQRAIWYLEPAEECPDVCIVPIDDGVYAYERWPVRIGFHAKAQCRWTPASKTDWHTR